MFLTTCSAYVHYWIIHFENYICTNFFHSLGLRTDWHGWLRSANNASGRTVPGNGRRQTSDIIHDTCYKASFCLRTKIEESVVPRHCTTSCLCGRTHDLRLLLWLLLCCRALRWTLCARAQFLTCEPGVYPNSPQIPGDSQKLTCRDGVCTNAKSYYAHACNGVINNTAPNVYCIRSSLENIHYKLWLLYWQSHTASECLVGYGMNLHK